MNKHFCSYPLCPARAAASTAANDNTPALSDDVISGAAAIAQHFFGDATLRRRVYHLAATSNLPFFRIGSKICVRRSALDEFIRKQERR